MRGYRRKKGLVMEALVMPLGIVVIAVIVLVISIIFIKNSENAIKGSISSDFQNFKTERLLGTFLSSPVSSSHADTAEELLVHSYMSGDYAEFEEAANTFFDRYVGFDANSQSRRWYLVVESLPKGQRREFGKRLLTEKETMGTSADVNEAYAFVALPRNDKGRWLRVSLRKLSRVKI